MTTDNTDTHKEPELIPPTPPALNGAGQINDLDDPDTLIINNKDSSAYKTIERNMLFWDTEADKIVLDIKTLIRHCDNPAHPNIIRLAKALSAMIDFRAKAVDAASKLIAFQSPKLAVVDERKQITHRFVIAAPLPSRSTGEWLEQAKATPNVNREEIIG